MRRGLALLADVTLIAAVTAVVGANRTATLSTV